MARQTGFLFAGPNYETHRLFHFRGREEAYFLTEVFPGHEGVSKRRWLWLRLRLRRLSANNFEFRTGDSRCWTLQGGAMRDGTPLVIENCNNTPAQVFTLTYSMGVMN